MVCASQHPFMAEAWDERVECVRLPLSPTVGYLANGALVARLFAERRCDVLNAHYATGYGLLALRSGEALRAVGLGQRRLRLPDCIAAASLCWCAARSAGPTWSLRQAA